MRCSGRHERDGRGASRNLPRGRRVLWVSILVLCCWTAVYAQRIGLPTNIYEWRTASPALYLHRLAFLPVNDNSTSISRRFGVDDFREYYQRGAPAGVVDAYVEVFRLCGMGKQLRLIWPDAEGDWPATYGAYRDSMLALETALYQDVMSPTWRFTRGSWIASAGRGDLYTWGLEFESNIQAGSFNDAWVEQDHRFSGTIAEDGRTFENERLVFSRRELWRDDMASIGGYCDYTHNNAQAQATLLMALFRELAVSLKPGSIG